MTYWRAAGLSYIKYSSICAAAVRNSLKSDLKTAAEKRTGKHVKLTQWKDGKPIKKDS
ncbi:hypothetical protein CRM22_010835 [Opisthorchis felineus]|uniref:Uncharacterized protein n=1 Tax=Opisthorchis felineus TaxID=147828 RepID=A0A4S2KL92_OPIFE|nr:hypothetical protein CRM22_010835 [Opisthorchis felineus]